MPLDVIFLAIAALLLFFDGTRPGLASKYNLQSIAFGFVLLAAIVWRY